MGRDKDQYSAIDAENGNDSEDVGVEFSASSPEDARDQAQAVLDDLAPGDQVAAVIDQTTGEETDF